MSGYPAPVRMMLARLLLIFAVLVMPLGFVSLTENLMMIAMALWMLAA